MRRLLLVGIFLVNLLFTYSQDAHYWTEHYGTRSMLLSNSIFGSVEDLGAVFYNPARLSVIEDNAFIISGKVYEFTTYSFENTTEKGYRSSNRKSEFETDPSLLAGRFNIKGLDKHSFAYSFLSRHHMNINIEDGTSLHGDVLDIPGDELFSAYINQGKKLKEEWMGLSWAYSVRPGFSIGISSFLSIRKQNTRDNLQMQAYTANEDVETYINFNGYNFSHTGMLWKIGLAWEKGRLSWGMVVTTPTISISGDGEFLYDRFYTGINDNNPIYEQYIQNELDVVFKTPFSVAAGAGLKFKWGSLHASAEYFNNINNYTLMTGAKTFGQSTNRELQAVLVDERNQVFNFGVGCNVHINKEMKGFLSYSTDFSAAVADVNTQTGFKAKTYASIFKSDIHHFGGGVVMNFKRGVNMTFGATLALTDYDLQRPVDFPDSNGGDNQTRTDINWKRWRFIVGVSIPFFSELTKKVKEHEEE